MEDTRIPLTVIGGFLGAGKTTLVNHLLRASTSHFARTTPGRRVGVIVNEFGQVGVDGGLIERLHDEESDVQELTAGCLCCTGRDDLIRALVLLAQRGQAQGGVPAHVLVELSGVADPLPVLQTLLDPDVRAVFRLEQLVAVADARHLIQTLREHPEGVAQLAYATTIVLNKVDLAPPAALHQCRSVLADLNPLARVEAVAHAQVDALTLLSTRAFAPEQLPDVSTVRHTANLSSVVLEARSPLTARAWHGLVQRVVSRPAQVLRVKGEVSLEHYPQHLTLHAVRDVLMLEPGDEARSGRTRVVMIGRDLDAAAELAAFAQLTGEARVSVLRRVKAPGVRTAGGRLIP